MRNLIYILSILLLPALYVNAQQVIVTDNAGYTPESSAMLDVSSTSKGFMPPRVALNSLTDVTTIPSPATGLMIYNTGAGTLTEKGIYYWNSTSWVKALIGGSGGTNYISIADDGTVILHGTATTYEDLRVDGSRVANSGASAPNWATYVGGLYLNFFGDAKEQSVYFNVQMPHAWKEGTDLAAHVHWTTKPSATAPGTNRVTWGIEYQWVNIASNYPGTTTTSTGYAVITPNGTTLDAGEHAITPVGAISGSGMTLSSVLVCRVVRLGNDGNDTYTGDAALLSIDFHYQIDSFGSSTEYIK